MTSSLLPLVKRPYPSFILLSLFLDLLIFGVVAPALPDMLVAFFDGDQSKTVLIGGIFTGVGSFISLVVSPILGTQADLHGRRPYLILSLLMTAVSPFVLFIYSIWHISLWFYFAANLLGQISSFGLALAYISDQTTKEQRTVYYGFCMIAMFLSLSAGAVVPIFASTAWTLRTAAIIVTVNIIFVTLCVAESLPLKTATRARAETGQDQQSAGSTQAATLLATEETPLHTPTGEAHASSSDDADRLEVRAVSSDDDDELNAAAADGEEGPLPPPPKLIRQESYNPAVAIKYMLRDPLMSAVGWTVFFSQLAEMGLISTILYYLKDRTGFNQHDNAILLVIMGISSALTMIVFFPMLLRRLGERGVIIFSCGCNGVRVLLYCFVNAKWQAYVLELFVGISFMSFPASSGIVSKYVSATEQGISQGAVSGVRGFVNGLGPLLFSGVYSYFTSKSAPMYLPQAPFFLGAAFLFVSVFLALRIPKPDPAAKVVVDQVVMPH